jgi:hypothetical protein
MKNAYQRHEKNSIRVGISPDYSLAYIDFLYATDTYDRACRPLCPIGQVKLPVIFKIAGHGTYFTPWYLDTNDVLLQAISENEVTSTFVDEAWIAFVVELNAVLKTVYLSNMKGGLIRLMKFFLNQHILSNLGGLFVELCMLPNSIDSASYPSERDKDHDKDIKSEVSIEQPNLDYGNFEEKASIMESSPFWKAFSRMKATTNSGTANPAPAMTADEVMAAACQERGSDADNTWFDQLAEVLQHANPLDKFSSKRKKSRDQDANSSSNRDSMVSSMDQASQLDDLASLARPSNATINSQQPNDIKSSRNSSDREGESSKQSARPVLPIFNFFLPNETVRDSLHTFESICADLARGKYAIGIRVSHPKVMENTLTFQDDDYDSDDGSFNLSKRLTNQLDDADQNPLSDDEDRLPKISPRIMTSDDNDGDLSLMPITSNTPVAADENLSIEQQARRLYGEKAKEMEKFYQITKAAESSLKAKSSSSATVTTMNPIASSAAAVTPGLEARPVQDSLSKVSKKSQKKLQRQSQQSREKSSSTTTNQYVEFTLTSFETDNPLSPRESELTVGLSSAEVINPVLKDDDEDDEEAQVLESSRIGSVSSSSLASSRASKPSLAIVLPKHSNDNKDKESWLQSPDFNQRFDLAPTPPMSRPPSKRPDTIKQKSKDQPGRKKKSRRLLDSYRLASSAHQIDGFVCHYSESDRRVTVTSSSSSAAVASSSSQESVDERSSTTTTKINVAVPSVRRSLARESVTGAVTVNFYLGYSISNILYFGFYDAIYSSLTTNILVGSNVYPVGTRGFRDALGLILLILCMIDVILVCTITTYYFCLGPDPTACNNHDAVILMFAVWPTAVIMASISGIFVILVGPDVMLTRSYASWLRLSMINTLIIVFFFIAYEEYFIKSFYIAYFVAGTHTCSLAFTCSACAQRPCFIF